jgi:hypothetical protein
LKSFVRVIYLLVQTIEVDDQHIQTDCLVLVDGSTQYDQELNTIILPMTNRDELSISKEIEVSIAHELTRECATIESINKIFVEQECQTVNHDVCQTNEYTQTLQLTFNDCASQSSMNDHENRLTQTEPYTYRHLSSLYIVPTCLPDPCQCSSTIVIMPQDTQSSTRLCFDQEIQCDSSELSIIIPIEQQDINTNVHDRRSLIQHQLDKKEKEMNNIIGKRTIFEVDMFIVEITRRDTVQHLFVSSIF